MELIIILILIIAVIGGMEGAFFNIFYDNAAKNDGKPLYLKDLPANMGNHKDLEIEDCGLFCDLEMNGVKIYDLEEARTMILKKEV